MDKHMWKNRFTNVILQRGQRYYLYGNVYIDHVGEDFITATVKSDSSGRIYNVEIEYYGTPDDPTMWCDCPYAEDGGNCKHMAAVMYEIEAQGLHDMSRDADRTKNTVPLFEEQQDKQYQYFDVPSIVQDVEFTEEVVEEAKAHMESGSVVLENIQVGYLQDNYIGNLQRAYSIGAYHDKNGHIFGVEFEMDKDDIISMECAVPKCNCQYQKGAYYWREPQKKACGHVAALMLLVDEYQKKHTVGDATDLRGIKMLESFRNLHAQKVAKEPQNEDIVGKVDIQPRLILEADELHLSFKIGRTKMYVMKSIKDFYQKNKNNETLNLGKNECIDLATATFTENAKRCIEYINREVKQEIQHKHRLEQKNTRWYAPEVKSESIRTD